ncbi:YycH family regulatory protein [Bacillus sp. Marseille-Q3570]|uniref:YycH family regulatory protein n=1 Tax=Bacillus sp. Marseille-Q3570 TaxID=2963522 RepID=UPI0021B752C0|nr:two-component system activity regulator YycH [Bacillus sp. Marseille-Q3570]
MIMKRFTRQLKKSYSSIWNNIEIIKTILLTLLIILSIFLTYNLWTFTPNNKVLENEATIETKIPQDEDGKSEKLANIIQPRQIVLHKGGEHFWSYSKDQNEIYDRLQSTLLISDSSKKSVEYKANIPSDGIDIVYPVAIPIDVLKETFHFSKENPFENNKGNVKRLRVFETDGEWNLQFVFEPEGNSYEIDQLKERVAYQFQLSDNKIKTSIDKMISSENTIQVESFELGENKRTFYLPVDQIKIDTYLYRPHQLDIDLFVRALLPSNVVTEKMEDRILYGKSKSFIAYYENENKFIYNSNWTSQDNVMRQNQIIQSLDFINNHAGWTDKYHLYYYNDSTIDDETTNSQTEIAYRMIINGFPVLNNFNSIGEINLKWTANQADEYRRSLTYLKAPTEINPPLDVLEKGSEVIEALSAVPDPEDITDITIGYVLRPAESDTLFSLEPAWYYKSTWVKDWVRVKFPKDEPLSKQGG